MAGLARHNFPRLKAYPSAIAFGDIKGTPLGEMSAQSTRGPVYRPITAVVLPAHWRDCLMNASFALAERKRNARWRAGDGQAEAR